MDALSKNDSLTRLDLSLAGLEWVPPVKAEERSAISTLLEVLNGNAKALEALDEFIISPTSKWPIPLKRLRSGPETVRALARAKPSHGHCEM